MSLVLEELDETKLEPGLYREDMLRLLGEQAVAMAHELKSPLNAIAAQVQLLARLLHVQGRDQHAERLSMIRQEIGRMDELITQYLQLGRVRESCREPLFLGQLCQQTCQLLRSLLISRGQELQLRICPDLPQLYGEEQRIRQVLVNLIVNASDACGGGGHVTLLVAAEPGWQTVTVRDDGPGVPADRLEHIFEAHYTTKAGGSGLGLAICRCIAKEHGGELIYGAAPGGGADFTLKLPMRA